MGDGLVVAMVEAFRRANRDWANASRTASPRPVPRSEGAAPGSVAAPCERRAERSDAGTTSSGAWGYLAHPALMPTVFSPSEDAGETPAQDVAARKV